MQFNWWLSLREIPEASTRPRVTIHLLANGKEIAANNDPVIASANDWQFSRHRELIVPSLPRNHALTLADLGKANGELALVVRTNWPTHQDLQNPGDRRSASAFTA
jgi:hypothetical protein